MDRKKLPIGIDNYKKLIDENYYYVDKTLFIKELLDKCAEVNLFTRPRRFGKTLNLSMLQYFFEKPVEHTDNAYLFSGKKIMSMGNEYLKYQGKYPVIQLSLKSGKQPDYEMSYTSILEEIGKEYKRHESILCGDTLSEAEQAKYRQIMEGTAEAVVFAKSLAFLSECLAKFENQKVIILIDEYDVPLENAYYQGFYPKMADFIRSLFESALKSNSALQFAVITGCLRISKESIFTGLNNPRMISILNMDYDEYFGFVQGEVDEMLAYYHMEEKRPLIKEWYDGYVFGKTEVYNPWSMVNFITDHLRDMTVLPVEYWSNTSSNSIVRDLIAHAGPSVKNELEILISGGNIEKVIHEDITYQDVYESEENLWNFLFFTGYLKAVAVKLVDDDRVAVLQIPNREVKKIYRQQIIHWTKKTLQTRDLSGLFDAITTGDADSLQRELTPLLVDSISYMDNYENFYHGFLLGILMNLDGYKVASNREAGDGRYDISLEHLAGVNEPVIIELKMAGRKKELDIAAKKALIQILEKGYDAPFWAEGYSRCIHIGIALYKKMCLVKCEIVDLSD